MLITKTVKIKPYGSSVKFYKEKGYNAEHGVELEVDIKDIPVYSRNIFVETTCDYCGKLKDPISYEDYNKTTKNGIEKCCCVDCAKFKREESVLKVYGYKNAMQVPEIKEKVRKTNQEKYGSNSPSGNAEVREKQKKTLMKNYGVESPSLSKEIQAKKEQTCMKKFGVKNPLLNPEIKAKIQHTILERYGVENVSQNKDIQNKRTQTFIDRYGAATPLQSKECLEKMKQTNLEIYGVENVMQLNETKLKAKQTNVKRYGYESIMQSPEFFKKWFEKNGSNFVKDSKQQRYLCSLYGGILNYPFKCFALDIYLPDNMLDIEFDGSGHRMSIVLGTMAEDEFNKKELYRNVAIKNAGFKQMRIISTKDLLPHDEILLRMLSDAKQYFNNYQNHSWVEYDIDNSIMRNAEYKDGIQYNYGELRRIKDSDLFEPTA